MLAQSMRFVAHCQRVWPRNHVRIIGNANCNVVSRLMEAAMRIEDLMTHAVHTCFAEDTLEQVAHEMWDCNTGCLVVIDTYRRPIGVLTDRDVAMAAYTHGVPLRNLRAQSAMSVDVVTCYPGTTAREVEVQMQQAQIRRVPVIDTEGMLVGIVTLGDLARSAELSPTPLNELPGVAITLARITRGGRRRIAGERAEGGALHRA
jgi:CBS domain-containing protein